MTQARFSGPNGIAPQFSANVVDEKAAEEATNAEMILSAYGTSLTPAAR
jgi:hypothetical protein